MVGAQIGNRVGVAAAGGQTVSYGTITGEAANTVTVTAAQARQIEVGDTIDVRTIATGAVAGTMTARTVTAVNTVTGVITYSGADGAGDIAIDGTMAVYPGGQSPVATALPRSNLNGGKAENAGFDLGGVDTIAGMRARLTAISATTYSAAELDKMTYNDLVYAIRVNDAPTTIKQ